MNRPTDPAAIAAAQARLQREGVHSLLVQFTDLLGAAKGKLVPLAHLAALVRDGAGFSGPSVAGTGLPRQGPRSEYHARADLATACALPWWPGVARVVGDGWVDRQPFEACPRQVLRRAVERLAQRGWQLQVGLEPEFFLLRHDGQRWGPADRADRLDKPSYDLASLARQGGFLLELQQALQACGLDVLQIDHEDALGQYELNFAHADALSSCDRLMLLRLAAQALAERRGWVFSLMPKPFADQPGSGLHAHVSLWQHDGSRNLFPDADGLTPLARHFMAGVLAHSAALCALAAPTVNSYKRLCVGPSRSGTSWAPACIAHGPNNRTALVRTLPDRFEWRLPDASANPYLVLAGMIAAGLDGVDRGLDAGPGQPDDLFELAPAELRRRGIAFLPQDLGEALDALQRDSVLQLALGPALLGPFVALKRAELQAHARHVSDWELQQYAVWT